MKITENIKQIMPAAQKIIATVDQMLPKESNETEEYIIGWGLIEITVEHEETDDPTHTFTKVVPLLLINDEIWTPQEMQKEFKIMITDIKIQEYLSK